MKCRRCKGPAVIDVRRHNAAFCRDCFLRHCTEQVRRAVDHFEMISPGERVLVAISGGKDSLGAWDLLTGLGYECDGLYLGLGIGEYSESSRGYARDFAGSRGLRLIEADLPGDFGFDIPSAATGGGRSPCGACGLSKRHLFNRHALEGGYDVVVTGHNLDDEAAVLLGNTLRAAPGFVRKVKPLVRLSEREMAAYCVLMGIDYIVEECPMAEGNRHLAYKEMLNGLEATSPGAKAAFLFSFWERGHAHFASDAEEERAELTPCAECGSPTTGEVCAFCRLGERVRRRSHPRSA
jgi:tRNA-5-methyluridine54 2-sulfurtransferase